jgi:hypothetical protein
MKIIDYYDMGYDDAASGRSCKHTYFQYICGYKHGLEKQVEWAAEELKAFVTTHNLQENENA